MAGHFAWHQYDLVEARSLLEESLTFAREAKATPRIASCLSGLAVVLSQQGDVAAARPLAEECVALCRALSSQEPSHRHDLAWALQALKGVYTLQGEVEAARAAIEESLAIFRELGHTLGIGALLVDLAGLLLEAGETTSARPLLEESLALFRRLDHKFQFWRALGSLARLAVAEGQFERGARLSGAVDALREAIGRPERGPGVWDAAARAALCEEAFAAAWAEGRAMSLEEAIQYALDERSADTPAQ
jgi:tetratricopeptide (TPR) repeat protein